jgi:biotin carboxyl carrier protein
MKSYWISATVVLLTAWPSSSQAYVAGRNESVEQSTTQETQGHQSQSPTPSSVTAASIAQEPSVAAKPAVITEPAAGAADAASPKPKDSYMLVELSRSLNAKKLKPGDKVKAEVSQDVVSHGKVIIPIETELAGHVTEVSLRDGENSESRLGIVFDRILLKHYHDIHFQAVVQAVAPPVARRSRVDEPSQMLPPSMVGGGPRTSSNSPVSSGVPGSTGQTGAVNASANLPAGNQNINMPSVSTVTTLQVPITVKQSPSTNTSTGTSATQLDSGGNGKPLSIGMPQGVTGLKGLSLTTAPSANTPGPVIVSETVNVKLEPGTQILLHIISVEAQK